MATPEKTTDSQDTVDLTKQIDEVVKATNRSGNKLEFPEGTDVMLQEAARARIQQKDAQREYTKQQQKIKQLEAEKTELFNTVTSNVGLTLSVEQEDLYNKMKYEDPDKWLAEMLRLKTEAQSNVKVKTEEALKVISEKAASESQYESQAGQLAEFIREHPDTLISADTLANDITARQLQKLKDGKVTYREHLEEIHDYLSKGKVIGGKTAKTLEQANMNNASGSSVAGLEGKTDINKGRMGII